MAIPNLLDPRMLSHVGEEPPLQQSLAPINLTPPSTPAPVAAPPLVLPPDLSGMGQDALPRSVTREKPQPTFAQILMQSIPLLVAGIAARKAGPAATSGMLAGYADAMEKRRLLEEKQYQFDVETAANEETRQARIQEQRATRQARIGSWILDARKSLEGIEDPGFYRDTVQQYDNIATKTLGTPPGFIAGQLGGAFDKSKAATRAQKDAQALVDKLETQYGDDLPNMIARGDKVKVGGEDIPIRRVWALAGRPQTPEGEPSLPGQKPPKNEFEQLEADVKAEVQRQQKERGGPLTPPEITAIRNDIRSQAANAVRGEPAVQTRVAMFEGQPTDYVFDTKTKTWKVSRDEQGQPIRARPTALGTGGGLAATDRADVVETVRGMIDGTLPPVLPGRGTREYVALNAEAHRQGFDLTHANEDWTATQKYLSSLNGTQQLRLRQAVAFTDESLTGVQALIDQWKAGKYKLLNKADLALAKNGAYGPEAASLATRLDAQIADITSELGTVYKGGNSSTDESLRLAAKNLESDWSWKTMTDAVEQIRLNLKYRKNSMKNVGPAGVTEPSPYQPGGVPAQGTGRQTGAGAAGEPPPPVKRQEPTINGKVVTGPTGVPHEYPTLAQAQAAYNALKAMK